jgi:cell division protein DivIC
MHPIFSMSTLNFQKKSITFAMTSRRIQYPEMDKLKAIYHKIKPFLNKYLITVVVFLAFIVFVDENNVIRRVQYETKIRELKQEIRHYRKLSEESENKLKKLHSSNAELERVAREDYLMKKPNEDVYIVE